MNVRLGRMPWGVAWLFCTTVAAAAPPSAGELRVWVLQLGGEDFAAREVAVARLADAGEVAIVPLIECIQGDSPEAAWRATAVLTRMAEKSDVPLYGKIVAALARQSGERVHQGQESKLTALIKEVSAKRLAWRRSVALETIRAYGGRFSSDLAATPVEVVAKPTDIALPAAPPDLPPDEAAPQGGQVAAVLTDKVLIADAYVSPLLANETPIKESGESLTIDQNWRGGDAGLSPLCDVPELCVLSLSRAPLTDAALDTIAQMPAIQALEIEDMSFSSAALTRFRQRQPKTRVVSRNARVFEVSTER